MDHCTVEGGHLLRLDRGDRLPSAIADFCASHGIAAATAEGLGALEDVVLGYFDVATRTYERTTLNGSWELVSLFADVASFEGKPFAHTHVVVSGRDFAAKGGHLFDGVVSVTAEIRLWTIERSVKRRRNESIGLHLWEF